MGASFSVPSPSNHTQVRFMIITSRIIVERDHTTTDDARGTTLRTAFFAALGTPSFRADFALAAQPKRLRMFIVWSEHFWDSSSTVHSMK